MSSLILQLPNNYVEIERNEMEYIDGSGWIAWTLGNVAGAAASVGAAMAGFIAGGHTGNVKCPYIGTINMRIVGALAGAVYGYMQGSINGYQFGRAIEKKLGMN